jgi:exodeoxyribonuclease V beta subunit
MHSHHYYLQADIYAKAMARYLALFDNRPFEEIFGGTYYVFLRGVGIDSGVLVC